MSAIDTILNAMRSLLPDFAVSAGSIEAKIVDVVGTYADSEAIERQNSVNVINDALATQRITTRDYYRRRAVEFQSGDILSYDPLDFHPFYQTVDTSKRIVKQAYIVGSFPYFSLLVNAIGSDGHLRPLTEAELTAFQTYFEAFQPLGVPLNVASFQVAQITDPSMVIYVRAGEDASEAAAQINANLLAYESEFRTSNTVTLSEIEDVIQRYDGVRAVGWTNPTSVEQQVDGSTSVTVPVQGVFGILNGAFSFMTEITPGMIQILN